MKIVLAQINTRVGDLAGNTEKIKKTLLRAANDAVDLVIFPELALTGYPPEDLVEKHAFVQKNLKCLREIAEMTSATAALCGFVDPNPKNIGHAVYNAAALMQHGKIIGIQHKSLLPNYDVFDELRHFEPANEKTIFELNGQRIGIGICEDAWNDKDFWAKRKYANDPVEELVQQGCDLLINISASPFSVGKPRLRLDMFRNIVRKYHIPCLFVNLIGGNDSLIFDGSSFALDADGSMIGCARSFEEDYTVVNLNSSETVPCRWPEEIEEQIYRALVLGVRDYLRKCGFRKALVGLSGGIDSAVVAAITADAVSPENVIGVSMPSGYSSEHSKSDAKKLSVNLGITHLTISVETVFQTYLEVLGPSFEGFSPDTTEENLQSRIRGNYLMALSNKLGAMVLSTGNKSELAVGYCTIYGDMCGGLAVISDVPKTMVYRLANWINRNKEIIPKNTILKPPSAELKPNQTDQDSLPPYDVLDRILEAYIEDFKEESEIVQMGFEADLVRKILRMVDLNEYKRRQAAPGLRVTAKAFGFGRRLPIAQGWRI